MLVEGSVKLVEVSRMAKDWGKMLSHRFRLSSFMLGFFPGFGGLEGKA